VPPGCSVFDPFDPFILTELDLQNYSGPHSNLKFELGPFEREVNVHILGIVKKAENQTRRLDTEFSQRKSK
jgi:hypothetical protein